MEKISIHTPTITLGQAIKLAGIVSSGIEAKIRIQDGEIKVNGEVEVRRGKKLSNGDIIECANIQYIIHENS